MSRTRIVCKKTKQRAVTQKLRNGEQPFFCTRHAVLTHTHCYEVSSKYALRLPCYGAYKNCLRWTNGRIAGQRDDIIRPFSFQNGRIKIGRVGKIGDRISTFPFSQNF